MIFFQIDHKQFDLDTSQIFQCGELNVVVLIE